MKINAIAAIAHAINAAYCASQGDLSQPTWADVRISEHRDRPFRLIVTGHFANA